MFKGIGCLSKPYRIQLKQNAKPIVFPTRKVPFAVKDKLKQTLDELCRTNIIEKDSDSAAEWVNPIVLVNKPDNTIRICLDPRVLNESIKRHYFQILTFEELTNKLTGCQFFTTLDCTQGFLQVKLDEES